MTGKSRVAVIVASTMLAGHHVFDVMSQGTNVLWEQTIFAAVPGSGSDEGPGGRIHLLHGVGKLFAGL